MSELIQSKTVIDMILEKKKTSREYARLMIHKAKKSGKLKTYPKSLKYGSRTISLYKPNEVSDWLDGLK